MTHEHPFAYLKHRADLKKCCASERNLVVQRLRPDLLRAVCTRCGRGHRKFLVEPGTLFATTVEATFSPPTPRILYDHHGQLVVK